MSFLRSIFMCLRAKRNENCTRYSHICSQFQLQYQWLIYATRVHKLSTNAPIHRCQPRYQLQLCSSLFFHIVISFMWPFLTVAIYLLGLLLDVQIVFCFLWLIFRNNLLHLAFVCLKGKREWKKQKKRKNVKGRRRRRGKNRSSKLSSTDAFCMRIENICFFDWWSFGFLIFFYGFNQLDSKPSYLSSNLMNFSLGRHVMRG